MSMTDEQIKQNAEDYINENTQGVVIDANIHNFLLDVYLAGAHSRNEEIEELQNELESLRKGFYERGDKLKELMLKNNELRNPWISVYEHPDDVTKDYLLEYEDESHIVAMWDSGMWMSKNLHPLKNPTHWMPIPKSQKGK